MKHSKYPADSKLKKKGKKIEKRAASFASLFIFTSEIIFWQLQFSMMLEKNICDLLLQSMRWLYSLEIEQRNLKHKDKTDDCTLWCFVLVHFQWTIKGARFN